jgi:hypothetical protein
MLSRLVIGGTSNRVAHKDIRVTGTEYRHLLTVAQWANRTDR